MQRRRNAQRQTGEYLEPRSRGFLHQTGENERRRPVEVSISDTWPAIDFSRNQEEFPSIAIVLLR